MTEKKARGTSKLRTAIQTREASRTVTLEASPIPPRRDAPKTVMPEADESPAGPYARLAKVAKEHYPQFAGLFDLANTIEFAEYDEPDRRLGELIMRHTEEHGPDHERFGGWPVVKRALEAWGAAYAKTNIEMLRRVLDAAIALNPPAAHKRTPTIGYIRVAIALERNAAGRLTVHRDEMLTPFLRLLDRIETQRIGRCQVCEQFFYATRLLPSGSAPGACPLHTRALRARRYRANHDRYHHRRKMRGAGVEP